MQFMAQDKYYRDNYPTAFFFIITSEGSDCGRLYVDYWPAEIRIMDIALLPGVRNRGIGSALLKRIMADGIKTSLPVSIHVEQFNSALRLYQRLGFKTIRENGIYLLLKWAFGNPDRELAEGAPENV